MAKHVDASKQLPGYKPIKLTHNGASCEATPGPTVQYRVGKKRSYNHRINGDDISFIVMSGVAGVPLTVVHSGVCPSYFNLVFNLEYNLLALLICISQRINVICAHKLSTNNSKMQSKEESHLLWRISGSSQ